MEEGEAWEHSKKRRSFFVKNIALVIILLFFLSITARALQVFTWPSLDFLQESQELIKEPEIQEMRQAVVEINVKRRDGSEVVPQERKGTGFNIREDGLIVTNRHIVENAESVLVTFPEDGMFSAVEVESAEDADLAVVTLDGEGLPVVPMEEEALPFRGETVTVIGNPLGYTRVVFRGDINDYRQRSGFEIVEIKAPIHPGSSGSPVFNQEGRVVAVVYAVVSSGDGEEDITGLAVSLVGSQRVESPLTPLIPEGERF